MIFMLVFVVWFGSGLKLPSVVRIGIRLVVSVGCVHPVTAKAGDSNLSVRLLASELTQARIFSLCGSQVEAARKMHVSCQNGSEKVLSHSMPKRRKLSKKFHTPRSGDFASLKSGDIERIWL